nr:MAG TPA: hypothetical protein [Caudoviricetes sp.]
MLLLTLEGGAQKWIRYSLFCKASPFIFTPKNNPNQWGDYRGVRE